MSVRLCIFVLAVAGLAAAVFGGDEKDRPKSESAAKTAAIDRLLARPDAFETLVNPDCSHCVDEAKRRADELVSTDRVLAWVRGNYDGGGIPLRFFLVPYRVISDTYGVFVYDAEAGFVRGYEPSLEFKFYGWRNGVMVMQHKDGTLFSTLSGRAFDGPRKGEQLKPVPTIETDWGYWSKAYPGSVAYHMFEKYQPQEVPTGENADSVGTRLSPDDRLPTDAFVLGLALGDHSKAYPLESLRQATIVTDRVGDTDLVALWYEPTGTAAVYETVTDGESPQAVSLKVADAGAAGPFVDEKSGSHFSIEGRALDGPLAGQTLKWLPGVQCRWFAWSAEFPQTQMHSPGDGDQAAIGARPAGPRGVLIEPQAVSPAAIKAWRADGYDSVALVLDERFTRQAYEAAALAAAEGGLRLYYWLEIGRNPELADEHPEWIASLGMHEDWRVRFPHVPPAAEGEVAKAWPWVPVAYAEAFDAHLARVKNLVSRAAGQFEGLLVNDIQAGPAACGCGNLLCRWSIDYGVPQTTAQLSGDDVAARFVEEVRKMVPGRPVIPVWTTECENQDLPQENLTAGKSTGLCGSVACSKGTCPKAFAAQWTALLADHRDPVGLLALHRQFERTGVGQGRGVDWIRAAIEYVDQFPQAPSTAPLPHERMWVVLQGFDTPATEQSALRKAADDLHVGGYFVAMSTIEQSYEPRIVAVSP